MKGTERGSVLFLAPDHVFLRVLGGVEDSGAGAHDSVVAAAPVAQRDEVSCLDEAARGRRRHGVGDVTLVVHLQQHLRTKQKTADIMEKNNRNLLRLNTEFCGRTACETCLFAPMCPAAAEVTFLVLQSPVRVLVPARPRWCGSSWAPAPGRARAAGTCPPRSGLRSPATKHYSGEKTKPQSRGQDTERDRERWRETETQTAR